MSHGMPRIARRGRAQQQAVRRATIKVVNLAVSVAGASGVGFGSAVAGDFPEGNVLIIGAVSYLKLSTTDVDAVATFTGNYSVGSAPTADATLSGSEVDLIPSTAIAAATAGVSPITRGASTAAPTILDNTDGSLEVNINVLIADASISGTADCLLNGTIDIVYSVLSDD